MIPFCDLRPQYLALKDQIHRRLEKVFEHGQYINGPEVRELEERLAQFVGVPYALVCSSGTDALLIPMMALDIGPGDEVITTAFSFIATAEVICLVGATPVFVDIDEKTYNLSFEEVKKAITPKTKAIVAVSLYGQTAELEALEKLAEQHGIYLLEDAAQSFGALHRGRSSCSFGIASGTSFFPAKPLGCYGDGGAIFTRDQALYQVMKEIREHGSERRYYHTRLGLNGRLDTLQCAILLAKLERYPEEILMREQVARRYLEGLLPLGREKLQLPYVETYNQSVWAQFTIQVDHRTEFQERLKAKGIPTSVHYPMTMPDQPWYSKNFPQNRTYPMAKKAAERVVSLPFYPDLDMKTQLHIIEAVHEALLSEGASG